MEPTISVVSIIQAMLAPGLMISACGLLILGMNNKYSMVVNRIRLLNEERRRSRDQAREGQLTQQQERLRNVDAQLELLHWRIRSVRNAVLGYSVAVACFIVSSLFIGLRLLVLGLVVEGFILASFILGVLAALVGVAFAVAEVWQGYKIMEIEFDEHC
jgi:hypothetical protein